MKVQGAVEAGFGAVADAFARNFDDPGEDAAALCLYRDGVKVVDLWGGHDVLRDRPVDATALMSVASASKGVTATVLAILIERGAINPGALVTDYWPEYGHAGKESTTVAMVASHRAGLPFVLDSGLDGIDHFTGPALDRALASATPLWAPGTKMAYHANNIGPLLDGIVTRATGKTIGRHVEELLRAPLGLDMWMGLPGELDDRVIPGRWSQAYPMSSEGEAPAVPGSYAALRQRAMDQIPPLDPDPFDQDQVRAYLGAERPAVGVVTDARSLARMYAATLAPVDGVRLFSDDTRRLVTTSLTDDVEALVENGTAGPDIRFGLGYQLPTRSMPAFGPGSYGHTGAGARLGLADADRNIGFGYVCSRLQQWGAGGDPRWAAIISAIDASI